MTDSSSHPDTGGDPGVEPDPRSVVGIAPWQKVVGIIGVVALLWVGNRMSDIVFADDPAGPGPDGNTAVESQEHQPGGPGGHGGGDDAPPTGGTSGTSQVEVTADDLAFSPGRIELRAGEPVVVALTAADIQHDLVVDEIAFHLSAGREEIAIGSLVFPEPGTFVGYCSVPGHREAGMELEIIVTLSDDTHQRTTA